MNKTIMTPLSDGLVRQALGNNTRILKYSELKNYETIDDLLPNINDFFIVLLEEEMNSGHWTCMMRTPTCYYYFNSYGQKYDVDISVIPMCIRKILGEDKREISRLLDGKTCEWNNTKLQGDKSQVCGRFCVLTITMICMLGYSPNDYINFLKKKKDELGKSYDEIVAKFVNI
jgi:hypothetical protein